MIKSLFDFKLRKHLSDDFPSYHYNLLVDLHLDVNFQGKRVVDIGGSNIPVEFMQALGVKQFVCIDPISKWENFADKKVTKQAFGKNIYKLRSIKKPLQEQYSFIVDTDVESLDNQLNGHFDIAVSFSTFEHVNSVADTMKVIHNLLNDQGVLLSSYEPIYSSAAGHHIFINDEINFSYGDLADLEFMHLNYTKTQARKFLKSLDRFTKEQITTMIDQAYNSPIINRFGLNDHILGIFNSPFNKYAVDYFYLHPSKKMTKRMQQSAMRHDVRGLKLRAWKDQFPARNPLISRLSLLKMLPLLYV